MKKLICALSMAFLVGSAWTIDVNRSELESAGASVEFENYGGPHAVIETARAIRDIGGALGRQVAKNVQVQATYGEGAKYTLIHAVTDEGKGKLDADILVLNKTAGVDHIVNLRRIITGFLAEAYGYSEEDAGTIATFVTVYNAVYRGDIDSFTGKYKENVTSLLDKEKVGLSTNWEEWAGSTQIVIPLGDLESVSAVETSVISDEKVVKAMQETEDKGITERTAMADIKEKESKTAQEKATEAQKEATEKKPAAAEAKMEARKDPLNKEKQQKAEKAQKEVEKAQAVSNEQQKIADKKLEEAQTEREEIKKDIKKVSGEIDLSKESYVNGLVRMDDKADLFGIVKVDAETGKIVRTSTIKDIRGSGVFTVNDITVRSEAGEEKFATMYMAVCGKPDGRSAVKLCLIDTLTLDMKKESSETLAEESALVQLGADFFAVVSQNGECHIRAFDKDLNLKRQSKISVKPTTAISVTNKGLMVTDKSGSPVILKAVDLEAIWANAGENEKATVDAK